MKVGFLTLLFLLMLTSVSLAQNLPALPQLPQVYVDTTMPVQTGSTITVNAGDNLQTAINNAQCGDTLVLQAGATFNGNFILPNKGNCNGRWIVIKTSAEANLPPEGVRVDPSYAQYMPKILSTNTGREIQVNSQANYYRFIGIEITVGLNVTGNTDVVRIGFGTENSSSLLPHHFVFDRVYIHGNPTGNVRRGIMMNGDYIAVIDSYISDFHEVGADTQAVASTNGEGPFKIVNNYLEAAGENVMFGGNDPKIQGLVPSDIEVRRNYLHKPLKWWPNDTSYIGIPFTVKNLFEIKNAQRVLIDGNIFDQNWKAAQWFAINIKSVNQNGGANWSIAKDITLTNNIVKHAVSGVSLCSDCSSPYTATPARNILIRNNLILDINPLNWGGSQSSDGILFTISGSPAADLQNVVIDHNTVATGPWWTIVPNAFNSSTSLSFTNNIAPKGNSGVKGGGVAEGNATLAAYYPGAVFRSNALVGANCNIYPSGNSCPANYGLVQFVNEANGDYHLAAGSPYKNAATDGKDIGADIDILNTATAGTISGVWNSSYAPPPPPPPSTCSDGTAQNACSSANIGKYCNSQLQLIDSCSTNLCGCPSGQSCNATTDTCYTPSSPPPPPVTCGTTPTNTCMSTKPQYCDSTGTIVDKCSLCACPTGYMCQSNDACTAQSGNYTMLTIRGRLLRNTASQTVCDACSITIGLLGVSNTTTTAADGTFALDLYKSVSPGNYIFDIAVNDGTQAYLFKRRGTIV